MAKILLVISCLSALQYQIQAQYLNLPIESPRNIISSVPSPYPLVEGPYNTVVPINPNIGPSSTTIITDCSPTTCKNLANTLQLMIVCNLLQNTNGGSDFAKQLAAPIIGDLFTNPTLGCGCANPFAAGVPGILPPGVISPNLISPNLVSPSVISPGVVSPNLYSNALPPNLVSSLASILGAGGSGLLGLL